jgi:hypothetical protein
LRREAAIAARIAAAASENQMLSDCIELHISIGIQLQICRAIIRYFVHHEEGMRASERLIAAWN